jgi:hypothetical protein
VITLSPRDMMEQFEAPALVGRAGAAREEEEEETHSTHPLPNANS